ncbi:MAG: zf-HC2 domain-containing protein [bacterium]|nr:zf-HC2 domain-containing protein [bacterium]
MKCKQIKTLVYEYLDKTLPAAKQEAVDGHLESCPGCAAFYRAETQTATQLQEGFGVLTESAVFTPDAACIDFLADAFADEGSKEIKKGPVVATFFRRFLLTGLFPRRALVYALLAVMVISASYWFFGGGKAGEGEPKYADLRIPELSSPGGDAPGNTADAASQQAAVYAYGEGAKSTTRLLKPGTPYITDALQDWHERRIYITVFDAKTRSIKQIITSSKGEVVLEYKNGG